MRREVQVPEGEERQAFNETERQVKEILMKLLSLPDINMNEHFVSLGGDSLIATELMAHLSATFGVNLSLLLPFEADTLQDLVAQIDILRRSYDDGAMEDERDEVSNLR